MFKHWKLELFIETGIGTHIKMLPVGGAMSLPTRYTFVRYMHHHIVITHLCTTPYCALVMARCDLKYTNIYIVKIVL